jgi:phosphopantothenoylcysteine decarboxylase/phosphopantothenate--cysteine ligase
MSPSTRRQDSHVLLAVTGSIAAYKAAEIARLLVKQERNVQVLLSGSAERFIGAETLAGITARPVARELFGAGGGEPHVDLAKRAELMLIAPATADVLARLAAGRADDLVSATALCMRGPVFVAPAMHPTMWTHPATRRNASLLRAHGIVFLGPTQGAVASGDEGWGRMLEPSEIVAALWATKADLAGRRLVISAGPTLEDLDPVRFLGNRSSGKMGFALSRRAAARGADVSLVAGPVQLDTPASVNRQDVRSALEMKAAMAKELERPADAVIMAAAVGDFRASSVSQHKLERKGELQLTLTQNPDIISDLAAHHRNSSTTFVAFAVETGSDERLIDRALAKLERKGVDLIVANHANDALGRDDNRAHLITKGDRVSLPAMSKDDVADAILDWLARHWSSRAQ